MEAVGIVGNVFKLYDVLFRKFRFNQVKILDVFSLEIDEAINNYNKCIFSEN